MQASIHISKGYIIKGGKHMKKTRFIALFMCLVMVFCALPGDPAKRVKAAESLVAYHAFRSYALETADGNDWMEFEAQVTVIVDPNIMRADVTFDRLNQYGKPLDYEKLKDNEVYQEHKAFFDQNYGHMTCDVTDKRDEYEASIKEKYKDQPDELKKYEHMYGDDRACYWYLDNFNWDTEPFLLYDDETRVNGYIVIHHYYTDDGLRVLNTGGSKVGIGEGGVSNGKVIYATQKFLFSKIDVPEQTKPIEVKTYKIKTDNFSFDNSYNSYPTTTKPEAPGIANFGGKFKAGTLGYMTDVSTYSKMVSGLNAKEIALINNTLNRQFGGACHGMSITSGLVFEGKIKPNQLGGGASDKTYDLKSPRTNNDLLKTILHYQVYGNLDAERKSLEEMRKSEDGTMNATEDIKKLMQADPDSPVVVGIAFEYRKRTRYHSVLAFKAEKLQGNYEYDISCYDPNFPDEVRHLFLAPSVMKESNYVENKMDPYGKVFVKEAFRAEDYYQMDLTLPVVKNNEGLINTNGNFNLKVGSQSATYINEHGIEVGNGIIDLVYGPYYSDDQDITDTLFIRNTGGQPITVQPTGGSSASFVSLMTSDSYVQASGGVTEFTVNNDGSVTAKTDGTEGTIAIANNKTSADLFGTTITTDAKEITVKPSTKGASVEISDGTADIQLSGKTDVLTFTDVDATEEVVIASSGKDAEITKDGTEIATGTADENGGSAEEPEKPEEPEPEPGEGVYPGVESIIKDSDGTLYVLDSELNTTKVSPDVFTEGTVYRMYNPNSGEHFYTKNPVERDSLKKNGWNYEANASYDTIAATEEGATPVYRVYNKNSGLHHYTANKEEVLGLRKIGWFYEGISFYVYDKKAGKGSPQYRLYCPNDGQHHWTVDASEKNHLLYIGWKYEDVAWNVK